MPLNNSLAAVNAGTKMDLVDAPNVLSVAVLQAGLPRAVEKADGAVLAGADALFTVAGGPVLCQLYGMVATAVVGTSTCRLSHLPTAPAVAVELNAAAVAIDNAAIGTLFYNVGATSVFTPVAVGATHPESGVDRTVLVPAVARRRQRDLLGRAGGRRALVHAILPAVAAQRSDCGSVGADNEHDPLPDGDSFDQTRADDCERQARRGNDEGHDAEVYAA